MWIALVTHALQVQSLKFRPLADNEKSRTQNLLYQSAKQPNAQLA